MRLVLLATLFSLWSLISLAQSVQPFMPSHLDEWQQAHIKTTRTSMVVLGTWAAGSILTSSLLVGQHSGEERSFHTMNIGWNAVNLGIAAWGYWQATRPSNEPLTTHSAGKDQQRIEKILLFNAGLDLAYCASGLYMLERGRNRPTPDTQLAGFGKSLILQGAFLFLFDLGSYWSHQQVGNRLFHQLDASPQGLTWQLNF